MIAKKHLARRLLLNAFTGNVSRNRQYKLSILLCQSRSWTLRFLTAVTSLWQKLRPNFSEDPNEFAETRNESGSAGGCKTILCFFLSILIQLFRGNESRFGLSQLSINDVPTRVSNFRRIHCFVKLSVQVSGPIVTTAYWNSIPKLYANFDPSDTFLKRLYLLLRWISSHFDHFQTRLFPQFYFFPWPHSNLPLICQHALASRTASWEMEFENNLTSLC